MNSESNIKQVSISGQAVNDYMPGVGGGKRTRRRARGGGNDADLGPAPKAMNSSTNLSLNITKSNTSVAAPPTSTSAAAPTQPAPSNTTPNTTANQTGGAGAPKPKIVIAPKLKSRKVILAPKQNIIKPHLKPVNKKSTTKRRLSFNIVTVKNKIAKTRKHMRESQSLPIDKIRKELIASKLLNPASKAPEALLRKIYADVKIIS